MAGAALTKPGRIQHCQMDAGPASDGEEEYERNQRLTSLKVAPACRIWWMGRMWRAPSGGWFVLVGELLGGFSEVCREAMVKVYGVAVAMPQGQSWAPPSSSEQQ